MLKHVLALPGQTVCRSGLTVSVVGKGELFVMNWQSADSPDGRYFGFLPESAVLGRAFPVWTWED
jgi:type IV secretory pathway protease TraF